MGVYNILLIPPLHHYLLLQTQQTLVLIPKKTDQVRLKRLGRHSPRRVLLYHLDLMPPIKVLSFLLVLIWVNVRVVEHKDIPLKTILFIGYCH